MNIFDRIFLWIFLLPTAFYAKMRVNPDHLKAILTAKLTIDNRRPPVFRQMKQTREKKEINKATLGTMIGSLVMGLFFLMSFFIGNDLVTQLTVYFSMFIFIVSATLITDFTSVLIDVRDNFIILPKPVSDATVVTSRVLHIAIHTFKIILPMSLPAIVAVSIVAGIWTVVPFLLMVFCATLLSIFLINALYILILKITTPSRFQSIISYFQIGFAIFIYGSYQLVPRMINKMGLENVKISQLKGINYYPPFWFADATNSLSTFGFNAFNIISLTLAIAVPAFSIILVIKYFAPSFNQKLSMINSSAIESNKIASARSIGENRKIGWIERLAQRLTSQGSELMGFMFTWKMMGRSRDFKMKVYPAFGYIIVMFVLFYLKPVHSSTDTSFNEAVKNHKLLIVMLMYFSSFIVITAIGQLRYSEKYNASWMFHITPLDHPGKVLSGAVKSVLVSFFAPVMIFVAGIGLFMIGPKILPNLLLGGLNVTAISCLIAYITFRDLPFTVSMSLASKGRTVINSILTTLIPVSVGFAHYFVFNYTWAVMLFSALSFVVVWLVLDSIKHFSWEKLETSRMRD